jgi:GAF domain-containing protein
MSDMGNRLSNMTGRQKLAGLWLAGGLTLASFMLLAFYAYFTLILQGSKVDISNTLMFSATGLIFVANLVGFVFIRRFNSLLGSWIVFIASLIVLPIMATLVLQNIYLVAALLIAILAYAFKIYIFPENEGQRAIIFAGIAILTILGIELWNPVFRIESSLNAPALGAGILVLGIFGLIAYFLQRALAGNIRSKIVAGILLTGGVSIAVLTFFAINQSSRLINTLADRVEISVNLLAEEQLINTVSSEASRANTAFETAVTQTINLANQLELLQQQKNTLGDGTYWNAADSLIQLSGGQYHNGAFAPSSIFVPSTVDLNESVIRDLNVIAYLDFSAPFVLENNPQITSLYYTNLNGIINYYPNTSLGASLLHNFDGTRQPTFRVATPLFDPDRAPRWTFPRRNPVGEGLIISVSSPVYFQNEFRGVMTTDFKLDKIAEEINSINIGTTGYAFLLDNDGHMIAMPPAGYEFFGLQPEILEINQEPQQTIFDGDNPLEVQQIAHRMVAGGNGLISANVGGNEIFIAYIPVAGNEFSLGVIVPVAELTQPVIATRNEINSQVQIALRSVFIILIALLSGAIIVSLSLGQVISAPVLRLTQTANQILGGNLEAQAEVTTTDETGTLAQAFNAMTSRLGETLAGLEQTVEERTSELSVASQNNERRAKQFQSISHVARTISSTLDLDSLLTQITTVISREFGFYHVGLFLIDTSGEYAVLSAANSEGGQIMLVRGHRLKVGEKGLVGFVSSTGKPRVALETGADAIFFNNPDLPQTRSEIALPLHAGEIVIGVLDVQHTEPNAFSQEDISILTTLSDQVSIAIQNARQNEQTKKALAESKALSQQFVQSGWQNFSKRQNLLGIRHTGAKATLLYTERSKKNGQNSESMEQFKPKGRGALLSIPIKLRGEVIGLVEVQAPDNRQWDKDEMDIVTAIIDRAAIAMENARLLTESQKRAAKEHTIGEISAKISAQSDIGDLLKTAAQELTRTLPGTEIAIQFRREDTE